MILIADSGSTKTDWVAADPANLMHTTGFNPFFHNEDFIVDALRQNSGLKDISDQVKTIYFFGAGCSSPERNQLVENALSRFFRHADITVDHDMLGTALSVCEGKQGIACILGTGSNICFFDGKTIAPVRHGLGYVLGDEGSGSYYGKKLLGAYIYKILPPEIENAFNQSYHISKEDIIQRVYQQPGANVYLASFAKFLTANKNQPYIQDLVFKGMNEFFETHILSYHESRYVPVHFVGSIAWYFRDILNEVAMIKGITPGNIVQKPITGLAQYFLNGGRMP